SCGRPRVRCGQSPATPGDGHGSRGRRRRCGARCLPCKFAAITTFRGRKSDLRASMSGASTAPQRKPCRPSVSGKTIDDKTGKENNRWLIAQQREGQQNQQWNDEVHAARQIERLEAVVLTIALHR